MACLLRIGEGCRAPFVLVGLLTICCLSAAGAPGKEDPGSEIFEGKDILQIDITIPDEGIRLLQRYHWGMREKKPQARATVKEGNTVYKDVAVQLKGSAGSFQPIHGPKPALTLKFDKFRKNQTFHGLEKISLNNSVQDSSYLQEKICREMYERAGIPVPRSDYALVTLNGRKLGLYVLVEGYNKQFLRRYFNDVSGNLYDGGFCQEITDGLSVNSGDDEDDHSQLNRLAAVASRQNKDLTELSEILDIDRFLTMVALEVIQCHWDGYTMNRNNYRVFHDKDSGKMIFMPHGMDQMFGTGGRASPSSPIFPPLSGMVARAVLSTKEGRIRYLERLAEVRTNIFDVEAITARVRQIAERIGPHAKGGRHRPGRSGNAESLIQSIMARAESIDQQLASPPRPAEFTNGIFRPAGWRSQSFGGSAVFDFASSTDGKKLLHVMATGGNGGSSWRTRVMLEAGRYQFEGYTRTRGAGAGRFGAHLRISGASSTPVLHGDTDWVMLRFPFDVREPTRDVELVCELKGPEGDAWFDTTTLKIRRLD